MALSGFAFGAADSAPAPLVQIRLLMKLQLSTPDGMRRLMVQTSKPCSPCIPTMRS